MKRLIAWILLAAAVGALLHGAVSWWPRTVDDAFITFRYSQNLADGLGPNFNPGERVEGYSTPTWMVLMAGAIAAGVDPVPAAKVLGIACSVALLFVLYFGLRDFGIADWGAALATLLLGSSFVLQLWSVSGMEANAFALPLFGGLLLLARETATPRSLVAASGLLTAAALTRPEGLAFWAAGLAWVAISSSADGQGLRVKVRDVLIYAAPGLVLLLHLLWRIYYYDAPLPNTYYAKVGGGTAMWLQGLRGLRLFLSHPGHLAWAIAAAAGVFAGWRATGRVRHVAVMAAASLLYLLHIVSVGDDGLRVHRFYVPILAPMAFLVGQLFPTSADASVTRRSPARWLTGVGIVAVFMATPVPVRELQFQRIPHLEDEMLRYMEGNVKLGRHLARTRTPDTLIAVAASGAVPFYSRLRAIDMYGLNDAHIARAPFPEVSGTRLMKWDNAYVLSREPDLIVINRGYYRNAELGLSRVRQNPDSLVGTPMDFDLFRRVSVDGNYGLLPIYFEDGSLYFVFERLAR